MRLPAMAPPGPVLVESDTARTRWLVGGSFDQEVYALPRHVAQIVAMADGRDVWHDSGNAGFLRTGRADPAADPSEAGPISECFRTTVAGWRTAMPVLSVAGTGEASPLTSELPGRLDPFGDESTLAEVVARDGIALWYGAPLRTSALLHRAERVAGVAYRYDKELPGQVRLDGADQPIVLRPHVRPEGERLEYDWDRIEGEACCAGVLHAVPGTGESCWWAPARALVTLWAETLRRDPLAFLDTDSRAWVAERLDQLGRRFKRSDFETVATGRAAAPSRRGGRGRVALAGGNGRS